MTAPLDTAGLVAELRVWAEDMRPHPASVVMKLAAAALTAQSALITEIEARADSYVEENETLASLLAEARAALADPVAVHRNMLAGVIAKPSIANIAHLYPEVQEMRQALIATLKHFRHPTSAEHETRDKVMAALRHFDAPPLTPYFGKEAPRG